MPCRVRDFLILHYHAKARDDSEFWKAWAAMEIPEGLRNKIVHFRRFGHIVAAPLELFQNSDWLVIMMGQPGGPEGDEADQRPQVDYERYLESLTQAAGEGIHCG